MTKKIDRRSIISCQNSLKHGRTSTAILGLRGCINCPYRWTCAAYDETNTKGCEFRMNMLVKNRKELGNVGQFLFEEASKMKMDLDGERGRLMKEGKSIVQNKEYGRYLSQLLDLSKYLAKIKYGETKTVKVEHTYNKKGDDFILVNPNAYSNLDPVKENSDSKVIEFKSDLNSEEE